MKESKDKRFDDYIEAAMNEINVTIELSESEKISLREILETGFEKVNLDGFKAGFYKGLKHER